MATGGQIKCMSGDNSSGSILAVVLAALILAIVFMFWKEHRWLAEEDNRRKAEDSREISDLDYELVVKIQRHADEKKNVPGQVGASAAGLVNTIRRESDSGKITKEGLVAIVDADLQLYHVEARDSAIKVIHGEKNPN